MNNGLQTCGSRLILPIRWLIVVAVCLQSTRVDGQPAAGDQSPQASDAAPASCLTPTLGELPPAFTRPRAAPPEHSAAACLGQNGDAEPVQLTKSELDALQSVFPATTYEHLAERASGPMDFSAASETRPIPERAFLASDGDSPAAASVPSTTGTANDAAGAELTLGWQPALSSLSPPVPTADTEYGAWEPHPAAGPPDTAAGLRNDRCGQPGIAHRAPAAESDPALVLPPGICPWWQRQINAPLRNTSVPHPVSINGLIAAALQCSAQVQVISDTPLIRDTAIIEADAAFDWRSFMETAWNERNEPVGSTLTTGGPNRFRDTRVDYELGFRRKSVTGGQIEIGQRYGYERSNSVFFVPNDQGTSRLTLNYTQPLLRGAGTGYSTSLIVLAQIDSAIARDDFSRQLQEHLLEITRAYWSLYLERANLLQRHRLYDRGQEILDQLAHRETIDAVRNQIVRARAAVAARRSDLIRAAAAVKNAEGRIRALVNAPELGVLDEFELMPMDMPTTDLIPVDLRQSLEVAMRKRPELNVALKQIKGSAVRLDMSKNELLPVLDVVLETYFAGLSGNSSIGTAWADQFSVGGPSYTAGLQFEVPLRNRESRARFQRRALELRQFQNQFRNTIHALQLEVEIAVREVETSYRELAAKYDALVAADAELEFIKNRWELLPGEDRTASLVLEDMLAAQDRLAIVEFDFANSAVTYNLALTNLKRSMGTLLEFERITVDKVDECGIPGLTLQKLDSADPVAQPLPLRFGPE